MVTDYLPLAYLFFLFVYCFAMMGSLLLSLTKLALALFFEAHHGPVGLVGRSLEIMIRQITSHNLVSLPLCFDQIGQLVVLDSRVTCSAHS
jgi:hypothetical protein